MIRLHIIAEGQSERQFVQGVLTPHLANFRVYADARCVMTSRDKRTGRAYRGGLLSYKQAKADICEGLLEDKSPECHFTTMFDLYALPTDFPGYDEAKRQGDPYARVAALERALEVDIGDPRFHAYIQLHEFEALILADPQRLSAEYLEHDAAIEQLKDLVRETNPELVNDGPDTAPSKRIKAASREYEKTRGASTLNAASLPTLRQKCPHFNEWVTKLERMAQGKAADETPCPTGATDRR